MSDIFNVKVPYEGYSRGTATVVVEAETEEEALVKVRNGEGFTSFLDPIRDDTELDKSEAQI